MTNPNASFGMFTVAQSVANPNGFDVGMIKAIDNTNGGTIPDNCTGTVVTNTGKVHLPRRPVGDERCVGH
jgi:hypothetical protein